MMQPSRLLEAIKVSNRANLLRSPIDWAVYAFFILLGAFQSSHYLHTPDWMTDVTYPDLARSILDGTSYQLASLPETTYPPGLPLILAVVGRFFGLSPAILFRVIAVCTVAGFIAAYELLRRLEGRGIAALACLLLGSSPVLFAFNTETIWPETPYFLGSMIAFLLAMKIDRSEPRKVLIGWELLLGLALGLTVLIRSVGVALLVGLVTWTLASAKFNLEAARRRVRRFLIPFAMGLLAQVCWSSWAQRNQILEWQLPGYPQSYVSQLKVKNGQYPELGLARVSDIPGRVERNVLTRTVGFSKLLLRRNVTKFWPSPAVLGVLVLIAVGLASSLRNGGELYDWYFLWYECIFMVWPWDYRDRFIFPIVPLACLYLWRGMKAVKSLLITHPKAAGLALTFVGFPLLIWSAAFVLGVAAFPDNPQHVRGDHLQVIAASLFWAICAFVGLAISRLNRNLPASFTRIVRSVDSVWPLSWGLAAILMVVFLVVPGVKTILAVGRSNMHPDLTQQFLFPEFEAANWIRAHEPSDLIVMTQAPELVAHYTHDRVVWFPPISDAHVLMDGVRRHHVGAILVVHHKNDYWLPPEDQCFQSLLQVYPSYFVLKHQGPDNWVYEVVTPPQGS